MKQFGLGYFKTYILLRKTPAHGDCGVLGIITLLDLFARVLIPGDGKQIRVQFGRATFLLRHLHLCCLFLIFSFPRRTCIYVPVRGMMS